MFKNGSTALHGAHDRDWSQEKALCRETVESSGQVKVSTELPKAVKLRSCVVYLR